MQKYTYICWIHTDAINNRRNDKDRRKRTSLTIFYLSLYCKGSKGLFKVCVWEGAGDWNILTPNLWPSALCLSRSLDAQPEARRPLCSVMAFFTASHQHLLRTSTHQGPKPPSAWCGFPYHISSITPSDLQLHWQLELHWVI